MEITKKDIIGHWRTYPAVSSKRTFITQKRAGKTFHVVFGGKQQKWCCQVEHKTIKAFDNYKNAKEYMENYLFDLCKEVP